MTVIIFRLVAVITYNTIKQQCLEIAASPASRTLRAADHTAENGSQGIRFASIEVANEDVENFVQDSVSEYKQETFGPFSEIVWCWVTNVSSQGRLKPMAK